MAMQMELDSAQHAVQALQEDSNQNQGGEYYNLVFKDSEVLKPVSYPRQQFHFHAHGVLALCGTPLD